MIRLQEIILNWFFRALQREEMMVQPHPPDDQRRAPGLLLIRMQVSRTGLWQNSRRFTSPLYSCVEMPRAFILR